jgi:hypothetical protein
MNEIFSPLYEFFYYNVPFSDSVYDESIYAQLGLISFISSLFLVLTFYYWIKRPRFSRWYHWSLILGINFIINIALGFVIPRNKFISLGLDYENEFYFFSLINGIISVLFFVVFSFSLRWWSINAKGTPIPN